MQLSPIVHHEKMMFPRASRNQIAPCPLTHLRDKHHSDPFFSLKSRKGKMASWEERQALAGLAAWERLEQIAEEHE